MENSVINIICPLIDSTITPTECLDNQYTNDEHIPDIFKIKIDWKEICKNCPYRKY